LTVIRQANRGVGAARNTGLDALTEEVGAIALLDSDDYYKPSHLRQAVAALSSGADFFFSNSTFEGETTNHFQEYQRRDLLFTSPAVQDAPGIFRWCASPSTLMGPGQPFATSTVVFRRSVMPEVRFPVRFRRAGEDQVAFWELFVRSSALMFSVEPTVVRGSGGLGIWRNSTFGSAEHLVRLADEIRLRRHVIMHHPLSAVDRQLMHHAIAARRYAALYSALHLLRRRQPNTLRELLYLFRSDPLCAASWFVVLPRLLYRKLRGQPVTDS
jgi:succinoglycan biosynthesis protein ExoW